MLFYYGRHFDSSAVGTRVVPVQCDKCRCEFSFELARVGSGSADAPYGIGTSRAARLAQERAERDLAKRLENDAELVPCPKCDWINEELVSRYRRGRYCASSKFAACVALFGTIVSMICAWFVSIGPAADRGVVPYLSILGPAISIAISSLAVVCRNWLRKSIQPNRDYPFPPRLPAGGPTPLLINPSTGRVDVAAPRQLYRIASGEWIDFQVGRHKLPSFCCECLAASEPRCAYRHPVFRTAVLVIPFCSRCAREWTFRIWLAGLVAFVIAVAFALPLLVALTADPVVFWILFGVVCGITPLVAAGVAYRMTTPVRVKSVDASRAIVRLWFRNEEYRNQLSRMTSVRA